MWGYVVNFDPSTVLVAVGGLFIQAVVGWVYVRILKEEVYRLRTRSDEHAEQLAEQRARLDEHSRRLDFLGRSYK
jgi:uncharacterized membrane-anchored protein YhcB (DUF1043 family)